MNAPETAAFRRHVLEPHSGSHVQNKPTPKGVGISEHVISANPENKSEAVLGMIKVL